jgi:hypothetical protein
MISFIGFFPLLFSSLILFLFNTAEITPDWFVFDQTYGDLFLMTLTGLLFFILFYTEELAIYKEKSNKKNLVSSNFLLIFFISAIGFLANLFLNIQINFRDIFQSFHLNILYSSIPILIFLYFSENPKYKNVHVLLIVFSSVFFIFSGSKASLISILLFTYFINEKKGLSFFKVSIFFIILIILFYFLPLIFNRYMDVGLSALNAISACRLSSTTLIYKYFDVIMSVLKNGHAFPPVLDFYSEIGTAPYNITPTVIGDILCGSTSEVLCEILFFLIFLKATLLFSKASFGISSGLHKYHLFMLIMLMSSNSFDIIKFETIYWILAFLLHQKTNDKKNIRLGL